MVKVKIGHAKLADANVIYSLGKKVHELDFSRKYPFHERSEIREFIRKSRENIFLVAKLDGKVVGFIYGRILACSAGGWCMLDNIAVDKAHRYHGIGTLLLKEFCDILERKKVHYVQVLEEVHHKSTREFWKKKGFMETKTFLWAERRI